MGKPMRCSALIIVLLLAASEGESSWYQKIDGTTVDPIQSIATGGSHPYSGNNLKPSANLAGAYLFYADLREADLSGTNLSGADLVLADLSGAKLAMADLSGADLNLTVLGGADISGSILEVSDYSGANWGGAFYRTDNEPIWHSAMDAAWRTSVGILALAPTSAVPEPSALLLTLFGLALLPRRRRR